MSSKRPSTVGSTTFDPDALFERCARGELANPTDGDLQGPIKKAFGLRDNDAYVYHAIASVTLAQVQQAVSAGSQHGLHAWYLDQDGKQLPPPPPADVDAYTSVFSSTTSTTKALTALASNAKKDSTRARVAANLLAKRHITAVNLSIPKLKQAQANPYLDYWTWSCRNLEWAGPDDSTVNIKQSHHVLPIFYHHFGCVCPSFEALEAIKQLTKKREIAEVGSGNGYWTYMLRRMGMTVHAVDNGDSVWRTMWIGDTVNTDGTKWLTKDGGAKDKVLLMVYPQVSTDFTQSVLRAYRGDLICVAGTQNANGFTGFRDMGIDEYMRLEKPDFKKVIQTPLPSFAGKDEAFFAFARDG